MPTTSQPAIQALLFDTFGTVVDWQASLTQAFAALATQRHLSADWPALARQWRSAYLDAVQPIRHGDRPWIAFDALLHETLDTLLTANHLDAFTPADRDHLVAAWHTLKPWPEAPAALARLKHKYLLGTLSNGSVRLLADMAKAGNLPWDVVLGGDSFHHFKPDPQVYLGGVALMDAPAAAVVMVAAHNGDLAAARSNGLRTAFVFRPTEDPAPLQPLGLHRPRPRRPRNPAPRLTQTSHSVPTTQAARQQN